MSLTERLNRAGVARTAHAVRRLIRRSPVSLAVAAGTTVLTGADNVPGAIGRFVRQVSIYHGNDLAASRWWRLPLSAFLAQSWLQLIWTLSVCFTLYLALESLVGSWVMAIVLLSSHILPTVTSDAWLQLIGHHGALASSDFGTSCMIVGAAGAMLWLQRSRSLAVILTASCLGDFFLNAPLTIAEHVLALSTGIALTMMLVGRPIRTAASDRLAWLLPVRALAPCEAS